MNKYDELDKESSSNFLKDWEITFPTIHVNKPLNCMKVGDFEFGTTSNVDEEDVITKGTIVRVIDDSDSEEFKLGDILVAIETDSVPYYVPIADYNSDFTSDDYMEMLGTDEEIPIESLTPEEVEEIGHIREDI